MLNRVNILIGSCPFFLNGKEASFIVLIQHKNVAKIKSY